MLRQIQSKCLICSIPSTVLAVEILPDSGIMMRAVHESDGSEHNWTTYPSIEQVGKQGYQRNPKLVLCPMCNQIGRVNYYRTNGFNKDSKMRYYVEHEKMDGIWGKKNPAEKHRRCYIRDLYKEILLRQLGRFIRTKYDSSKSSTIRIICPICKQIGRAGTIPGRTPTASKRLLVEHGTKKTRVVHYMVKKEDKDIVFNAIQEGERLRTMTI